MMKLTSPTHGQLSLDEVVSYITKFINKQPRQEYVIAIGSDSQKHYEVTEYVVAITVHRVGKGAIVFYSKKKRKNISFKQRLITETTDALDLAFKLTKLLPKFDSNVKLEVHADVSTNKESKSNSVFREVVGMIMGCGFKCVLKPDGYAASSAADKFSK